MKQANAAQKKWMSDIAQWAQDNLHTMYDGGYAQDCNFQLHHVVGRSYKQNKVAIGHWFIIPIPFDLHDVSSNCEYNVTHHKHNFTDRFGNQRDLFSEMFSDMELEGYEVPPYEVLDAIKETRA